MPLSRALRGDSTLTTAAGWHWMVPQGSWSLGQLPEGVQRGILAAGLNPPSPCGKMYSSWGRAPRDRTSAKGKQNPSVCLRNCHKVQALCSDAAAAAGRRHGRACVLPTVKQGSCREGIGRRVPWAQRQQLSTGSRQRTIWGPFVQGTPRQTTQLSANALTTLSPCPHSDKHLPLLSGPSLFSTGDRPSPSPSAPGHPGRPGLRLPTPHVLPPSPLMFPSAPGLSPLPPDC